MTWLNKLVATMAVSAAYVVTAQPASAVTKAGSNNTAWSYMVPLTVEKYGIGARPAGSDAEKKAAKWLQKQWQAQGYQAQSFGFKYQLQNMSFTSENLVVDIKGQSEGILIVGAHFDSTGHKHGSLGATDNASGVAALLALSNNLKDKPLPFNVRLIAFGAEEVGLQGAKAYVSQQLKDKDKLVGMINLDTIIGGDKLYVHSAHTTPYKCDSAKSSEYNSQTHVRDGLLNISETLFGEQAHALHPAYEGYPEGVTGSWSDHSPFACIGVPIAYLEATNFAINGHSGNDGYSQTETPELWDCYDAKTKSACDRKKEKKLGHDLAY